MSNGEIKGFYWICTLKAKDAEQVAIAKQAVKDAEEAVKEAVRATNAAYELACYQFYYGDDYDEDEELTYEEAIDRELDAVFAFPGYLETEESVYVAQRKLKEAQKVLNELYEVNIVK